MLSTVCLIAKNEERAIAEWLAYQRVIGFDRVLVYDNGSIDSTRDIILHISKKDVGIEYISWPDMPGRRPQVSAYADATERCQTEWIAFFDTDEFLVIDDSISVDQFLAGMDASASAIAINWLVFGSSARNEPGEGLVIERFMRCAPRKHGKNLMCKSILRRGAISTMLVHTGSLKTGYYVDAVGRRINLAGAAKTEIVCIEGARLNHYLLKSREEFKLKRSRGHASRAPEEKDKLTHIDEEFWGHHDLNQEEDKTILRSRANVIEKLTEWDVSNG